MLEVRGLRQKLEGHNISCLQPQAKVREADLSAPPTSNSMLLALLHSGYSLLDLLIADG